MSRIECTWPKAGGKILALAAAALLYAASPVASAAAEDLPLTDIDEIPQGQQLKELFPGAALIMITQVVNGEPQELAIIDRQYGDEGPFSLGPKEGGTMTSRTDLTIRFEFSPGCTCKKLNGGCVWIPTGCNE